MQLIHSFQDAYGHRQADIYEMAASGFSVFIYEKGHQSDREGFVLDRETDALSFVRDRLHGAKAVERGVVHELGR